MKKYCLLTLFLLLIIIGCTSQLTKTEPMAQKIGPSSEKNKPLTEIYKYGSVKEYQYKITGYSENKTTSIELKTTISSDNLDNVPSWLTVTEITMQGASSKTKTWIDKVNLKCLKITTETTYAGNTYEQEMECPKAGVSGTTRASNEAEFIGTESITIPLGTFTANKYQIVYEQSKAYMWVSSNIPIPLKVEQWTNETVVSSMELMSYS